MTSRYEHAIGYEATKIAKNPSWYKKAGTTRKERAELEEQRLLAQRARYYALKEAKGIWGGKTAFEEADFLLAAANKKCGVISRNPWYSCKEGIEVAKAVRAIWGDHHYYSREFGVHPLLDGMLMTLRFKPNIGIFKWDEQSAQWCLKDGVEIIPGTTRWLHYLGKSAEPRQSLVEALNAHSTLHHSEWIEIAHVIKVSYWTTNPATEHPPTMPVKFKLVGSEIDLHHEIGEFISPQTMSAETFVKYLSGASNTCKLKRLSDVKTQRTQKREAHDAKIANLMKLF